MGSFGSFYKGEKKKKKQAGQKSSLGIAPIFIPPKVFSKGKLKG